MISLKEIQYVSQFARLVPFPGVDYARSTIDALANALRIYKEKYDGKKYSLILSDGREFEYEIQSTNLSHLLGIDYRNLTSDYMKDRLNTVLGIDLSERINSYEVLERIIEYGDEVIKHDQSEYYKMLNYYKLMIKTTCFYKFADFNNFNFGCISFNKDLFEAYTSKVFSPLSTIFLFSPSDEASIPYCMMGFKVANENGLMLPETFMAPVNFGDFLYKQTLLLPVQLLIDDNKNLTRIVATPEEKIRVLNLYKSLINQYGSLSHINIYNDYEVMLNSMVVSEKEKKLFQK